MKKTFIIFSAAGMLLGCAKSQSTVFGMRMTSATVFIIDGDSNSGGIGANDSATIGEIGSRTNVKIINNHSFAMETMNIGVNNNFVVGIVDSANTHGIELGLANSVDSGRFLTPAYVVKTGYSGAKISTLNTTYWGNLNTRIDSAIGYLNRNSIRYEMYMFLSDGINDSNAHVDSATWKASLKTYLASIRSKYGRMPTFMPYIPLKSSVDSALVLQYNIIIGYLAGEVADFYPIQSSDCYTVSGPHFPYSSFKILAARMVAILKSIYKFQ